MNNKSTVALEPVPDTTRERLNRIRRVTAFFIVIGSMSLFGSIAVVFYSPLVAYLLLMAKTASYHITFTPKIPLMPASF